MYSCATFELVAQVKLTDAVFGVVFSWNNDHVFIGCGNSVTGWNYVLNSHDDVPYASHTGFITSLACSRRGMQKNKFDLSSYGMLRFYLFLLLAEDPFKHLAGMEFIGM